LVSLLFLTPIFAEEAPSQPSEADKGKVVRQVAQRWIQVGAEQYKRGYFKAAKQSFLRAQDYQEYLTADEREKLNALLEKTHKGIIEREYILETIRKADELVKQGDLIKAKASLEEVKGSEFLTEAERELITKGLENLYNQLEGQKKEVTELYKRSVEFYKAGELEKAREGFVKIAAGNLVAAPPGETAEDYLLKIDNTLAQKTEPSAPAETHPEDELGATIEAITKELIDGRREPNVVAEQQVVQELEVAAAPEAEVPEPAASEETYIEVINRKRNIRQSHTRAVVNDAIAKVHNYINQNEFDKAKEEVERAERIVNEYQLDLGEELFSQHRGELKQLAETIIQEQEKRTQQLQEQKQLEAIESQRRYREQMEADRSKRIAELMDNAITYQSEQRYEEALGQLDSLLVIDPLNNQALILKQTLEDTVSFRRQLEAQRESDKERVNTLIQNDEAMIPYADELRHPKDWRDIIASPFRQPEPPMGRTAADAAVYKQLDEIVDLSQLTPQMPLSEAIEVLKNSVDPPLKIFVKWRDLYDNADVEQTTAINMDPISAIPLRKALVLLLEAVSGGFADISFIVDSGIITIATADSLPSEMETLAYDITDLIGRPAEFYAQTGAISVAGGGEAGTEELEVEELDRDTLIEEATIRANNLMQLILNTIQPASWFENGGEGTITIYERKKLIIYQTREIHNQIEEMLNKLRKSLGHQVAIEARFLVVGENFLEDVGLDVDIFWPVGGRVGLLEFTQDTSTFTLPSDTGVSGSWGPTVNPPTGTGTPINAMTASGGFGNLILNQLQVNMLLRATQAHRDSKSLIAPKVTVLNGEMASFRVQRIRRYPYDIEIDIETIGEALGTNIVPGYMWTIDTEEGYIVTGTILNISPTITPDKRNVLLNIVTEMRDFLGWQDYEIALPVIGATAGGSYTVQYPDTEISRVETRVSVPDRATLLLGGQRITADVEREAGVPVLSKVPFLGRLFNNRSKVKDSLILLILVKPTIILREEAESKAIAAMESSF
jgi:type II secretory pathway component GspD/PulD (secretin)